MTDEPASMPRGARSFDDFTWLNNLSDGTSVQTSPVHAFELDAMLWRGLSDRALPRLEALLQHGPPVEKSVAGWVLARWYSAHQEREKACAAIERFHAHSDGMQVVQHPGPFLLASELYRASGDVAAADDILSRGLACFGTDGDFVLARFQLAKAKGASIAELSCILGELYDAPELVPAALSYDHSDLFDRLEASLSLGRPTGPADQPLVSVIVPVFNAARELPTALRSLTSQTWNNLEILVLNDGSSDGSFEVAKTVAARDKRIRVIDLPSNCGAYPARNHGFQEARGSFVTVHDSDDWSHPQKIELQARALIEDPALKATVSHWVRASNDLSMSRWRMEEGWIYRNVSSLMVRAEMRDELGYWDRVKVNADTEYYYRIQAIYGAGAIKEIYPGIPLAFARTLPGSLTNQSATHFRTQFKGVRQDYMEAANHWHAGGKTAADLYLPCFPSRRPFRVPPSIALDDAQGPPTEYDVLAGSEYLDEDWYLIAYPQVLHSDMSAARHYLMTGASEGLDPGPLFSSTGYRVSNGLSVEQNPLLHFIRQSEHPSRNPLPRFESNSLNLGADRNRVLVFAHTAGATLFGAERSFLNVLARLLRDGQTPVAVLPKMPNAEYLSMLLDVAAVVEVLPQAWRNGLYPAHEDTVDAMRGLIERYQPNEVHVNTVVIDAPLIAARLEAVPTTMYVRELPAEDDALCRTLGISAEELRRQLMEQVDEFIMPSKAVADWLDCPGRCTVRPNAVDEALFGVAFNPGRVLTIALISSNIAKKGIADLIAAARILEWMGQPARFLLIGPDTLDLRALMPLPSNVVVSGYIASPIEAIKRADIVMSLSKFAESFGRTVLEAMAAGRPVICYDRGAPPTLNINGKTGLVVPADSVQGVVNAVLTLDAARIQLGKMSRAARLRAREIQNQALA